METLKMISSRKAIRSYSGQVTDEQLKQILTAANAGPAGMGNYDDYSLTVIQKPEILAQLSNIYDAPTVIVISAKNPSKMEFLSAGAIVHNMELAAEDQGVGANYNMACVGSVPSDIIPASFVPIYALTVGQTNETFVPRDIPDRIKINTVE